jgi:hypothetical protein
MAFIMLQQDWKASVSWEKFRIGCQVLCLSKASAVLEVFGRDFGNRHRPECPGKAGETDGEMIEGFYSKFPPETKENMINGS